MSLEKTIYVGTFVQSQSLDNLEIIPNGMIGVDESGKIAFVTRQTNDAETPDHQGSGWENARRIKVSDHGFFCPGFIDTHIHAPQYPNAGIFGKSTLLDWLETYTFPTESSLSDLSLARKIYNRVVRRTLSHGTTTACYYATRHVPATNLLADICQSRGQRAFVGRVCMDQMTPAYYRDESVETAIRDSRSSIDYIRSIDPSFDLISPIITPRFAISCSEEALAALGALHRETGVPCQTHLCENTNEIALVKKMFPKSASYTHVYDDAGLLTNRMILAHAVHLTDEETQLIKSRDAKISHCPASNTALTSGTAKVRKMLEAGLTVGLGTDVSGGFTSSMLAQIREAVLVSRHVAMTEGENAKLSVDEAFYLATRGGAKVVGLEDRIGGFEVGKDWDAQMVELTGVGGDDEDLDGDAGVVDVFGKESWSDRIAKWVYIGDDRNTRSVWVKGRLVHTRGTSIS